MYRNAQHAKSSQTEFGRKVGTGLVAGCLALSMLPAVAFAAPGQGGGPGQGSNGQQPAQMSQEWQAPQGDEQFGGEQPFNGGRQFGGDQFAGDGQFESDGQQSGQFGQPGGDSQDGFASRGGRGGFQRGGQDGQELGNGQQLPSTDGSDDFQGRPDGQPAGERDEAGAGMRGDSELDARIIAAIPDDDVRARAEAGNPDAKNLRPAIPEGEVNVQQIIDAIRQALLEAGQFSSSAPSQASQRMGDRQFAQAPNDIAAPSDSVASTDGSSALAENADASAPSAGDVQQAQRPGGDQVAPTGDDTSGLALFQKIVETIKSAFGL